MPRRSSNPAPAFVWSPESARYRDAASGRFVPRQAVRQALDGAIDKSALGIRSLSEQLRAGTISLPDWQRAMVAEVKSAHLAAAALAKGGWNQMAPADWLRAASRLKAEYAYLARFGEQVASGKQRLDGTLTRRATMYVESARMAYHAEEQREQRNRGAVEERSVLNPADHCTGPGSCVEEAAKGWQPLGEMLPIGRRLCRSKCKCGVIYRTAAEANA